MRKGVLIVIIGLALIMATVLAGFSSACASTGYFFNGGCKVIANRGAALTIETQNPYVATGSALSAWAMTCDTSAGQQNYAQVGWLKYASWSNPRYFYEYSSQVTNKWDQQWFATATSGSHNDYMVGSDSTTMYFKLNGTQLGTLALSDLQWTPSQVQFFGETHDTSDQCPGSVSNPVTMGAAQYKNTSYSWVSAGVTEHHDLSTMSNNISYGATTWEIWDTRY
jgi:hypothetical protein